MSSFADFLRNVYAPYFGVIWDDSMMSLKVETPASVCFEIEDKRATIVQPPGRGVSVIRRTEEMAEVLDIENFIQQIHREDNTPSCCDFVISPSVGKNYILLNELTRSKSNYILHFNQSATGMEQEGKLETARRQLTATINRLYEVSDFCDQYADKTALFSCRLSDKTKKGIMTRSAKAFNKTIDKLQKLRLHETLPHGFSFIIRVYNEEYKLK